MRLTSERVHSARAVTIWALRSAAVLLVAVGAYRALQRLVFGVIQRDMDITFHVWEDIGLNDPVSGGVAMVAVGVALALLSRRIARWVIVPAERGCPGCGYPEAEGACPECGLRPD